MLRHETELSHCAIIRQEVGVSYLDFSRMKTKINADKTFSRSSARLKAEIVGSSKLKTILVPRVLLLIFLSV
jgi:hypothetical protein